LREIVRGLKVPKKPGISQIPGFYRMGTENKETIMSHHNISLRVIGLLTAVALLAACAGPSTPTPTSLPRLPAAGPRLRTELVRGCQQASGGARGGPFPGELAIDFTLKDVHGDEYRLSRLLAEKPVVMIFGSFT
jgi:hypothetical protein